MKEKIAEGMYLLFQEEDSGKFSFTSDNAILKKWCDGCKQKKVKLSATHFVVKAAKEYLRSGAPEVKVKTPNFGGDSISELNYICQQRWQKTPVYRTTDVVQYAGFNEVTVEVVMPDGETREETAPSAKLAKQLLANELLEDYKHL